MAHRITFTANQPAVQTRHSTDGQGQWNAAPAQASNLQIQQRLERHEAIWFDRRGGRRGRSQLVVRRNGETITVRYEQINAMLLNEFLKEHKKVEELQATVAQQYKGMEVLSAQLKEQAAQIQKVNAQLEMIKPGTKIVVNEP